MGLIDGAGTDADGGESGVVEVRGVGEPRSTDELTVRLGSGELLQPRMSGGHVHGRSLAGLGDGEG